MAPESFRRRFEEILRQNDVSEPTHEFARIMGDVLYAYADHLEQTEPYATQTIAAYKQVAIGIERAASDES